MQAEFIPKQIQDQQDVIVTSLDNGSTLVWVGDHYETRPLDFTDLTGTIDLAQFPPGTIVSIDSIDADALYFFDNALFTPRLVGAEEAANFVKPGLDLTFVDISGTLTIEQLPPGTAATVDSIGENALFYYDDGTATPSLLGVADLQTFLGITSVVSGQLFDSAATKSIDFGAVDFHRGLYNESGNEVLSWSTAFGTGVRALDTLYFGDGSQVTAGGLLADSGGFIVLDIANRVFYNPNGTTAVINFGTNGKVIFPTLTASQFIETDSSKNLVSKTAAQMRTDLGLVIGTNVQAWDADLDALAALSGTNNIYYRSAANTWSSVTIGSGLSFSSGTLSASGSGADNLGLTPTAVKTSNYTAAAGDFVPVDTTSGNVTITFPTAPADKTVLAIKHVIQGGSNTVSLALGGSDVFNKSGGSTSGTLTLVNQAILVQYKSSGAIWYVVSDDLSLSALDARYVPISGALGTPSSGTLTNCTGLPIAGLVASTSTAIGVGSIELGNASDCTLARSVTARLTVEGTNVILQTDAVSILAATTSGSIGVGSIELGHASDTTLTRVSAGVVAIEGSNILKASNIGGSVQAWDADLDTLAGLTATTDNFIVSVSSAWASRTPSQVKTTLGLVIGTNVQAWDADLDTLAGLTATTDNFIVSVSSAWASRTPTQVKTTLGLTIGTNVQAWDADLDTWATVTPASNMATFIATPSSANLRATMTDEIGTGACVFDGATLTQLMTFATCGSSLASFNVPAGTVPTTPNDGDFFADANCFYGCTDTGNPGVVPVVHIIRADSTVTQANDNNAHAIFTTPTNGTLTLETGTYRFHGTLAWTSMSATSGNVKIDILGAGSATTGAWLWTTLGFDVGSGTANAYNGMWIVSSASGASAVTATTGVGCAIIIDGSFEVTGVGTIIPTQTLVTAAAAVLSIGSYIEFWRVGSTSMTSVGQWT